MPVLRLALLAALLIALALAAPASADISFTKSWGWGVSDGMSQFETCTISCRAGTAGGGAGQLNNPYGVTTGPSGNVYVADAVNYRVDEFSSAGAFIRAWGWGVSDGMSQLETCTTTCEAGIGGGGAGQLAGPYGVATDASGNVYVADNVNNRVDEFSSAGAFIRAWGWGVSDGMSQLETCTTTCQAGLHGAGAGELFSPYDVAVNSTDVYVSDASNDRIDEFSSAGAFIRAWGWGVSDGMSQVETCTTTCQAGRFGGGAGQLAVPNGVATDTSGNVYVSDVVNYRVDEFSSTGGFIRAWGWGVSDGMSQLETCTTTCEAGISGYGAGQIDSGWGIGTDSSRNVYVADNNRVDEFSSAGAFIRAWGWGVSDGMSQLETCTSTCQAGTAGGGAGQLAAAFGVASDTSGNVYVADGNSRINEFVLRQEGLSLSVGAPASGNAGSAISGSSVSAVLSGGSSPSGTITFTVFGPQPSPPSDCSGGTTVGTASVSGSGTYDPSADFTPPSAGDYWWYASYTGDPNNDPASSGCPPTAETVVSEPPSVGMLYPASAALGSTYRASASLSGGSSPSGTITLTVFGPQPLPPSDCSGGTTVGTSSVSGDGSYDFDFTPVSAGDYWWYASYSGDPNNGPANSSCPPTAETVVGAPALSLRAPPSARAGSAISAASLSAGLSGRSSPSGTITLKVFGPQSSPPSDCSGGTTVGTANVTDNGTYHPSADFTPPSGGDYWWYASYSGDPNNDPADSGCPATIETVVSQSALSVDAPATGQAGSLISGSSVSAVLSGGSSPSGTITLKVFGPQSSPPSDCSGGTTVGTANVSDNGTYHPVLGFTPPSAGDYWWYASYSGDPNNDPANSDCPATVETVVPCAFSFNGSVADPSQCSSDDPLMYLYFSPPGDWSNCFFEAQVDWGDGHFDTEADIPGGRNSSLPLGYRYAHAGTYFITVDYAVENAGPGCPIRSWPTQYYKFTLGGGGIPVVLVTGLSDSHDGMLPGGSCAAIGSMAAVCSALQAAGFQVYVPMASDKAGAGVVIRNDLGVRHNAASLTSYLSTVVKQPALLVGHSMGGLISRDAIARKHAPALGLFTIGAPFEGSFAADIDEAAANLPDCGGVCATLRLIASGASAFLGSVAVADLTSQARAADNFSLSPLTIPLWTVAGTACNPSGGSSYSSPNDGVVGYSSALGDNANLGTPMTSSVPDYHSAVVQKGLEAIGSSGCGGHGYELGDSDVVSSVLAAANSLESDHAPAVRRARDISSVAAAGAKRSSVLYLQTSPKPFGRGSRVTLPAGSSLLAGGSFAVSCGKRTIDALPSLTPRLFGFPPGTVSCSHAKLTAESPLRIAVSTDQDKVKATIRAATTKAFTIIVSARHRINRLRLRHGKRVVRLRQHRLSANKIRFRIAASHAIGLTLIARVSHRRYTATISTLR